MTIEETSVYKSTAADSTHTQMSSAESLTPGILDVLLAITEKRRLVTIMTLVGAAISVAVALMIPPMYTASTVIMPPQQQQSMATALLGQLGSITGLAGSSLIKSPADLYIGILGGRTIADGLITKFDLRSLYKVKTAVDARKALASHTTVSTGKDSLIRIAVEDRDPGRAARIANSYVEELQVQNSRLALTESAQRRLFFEKQLESEKLALAESEDSLAKVQKKTGVIELSSQAELAVRSVATVQAEIASREVLLQALKSGATDQNPDVVRQQEELKALRAQLAKLESTGEHNRPGNPVLPTARLPEVGLESIRRLRDLKYHETLFELLSKQYEIARIDEAKESPVVQVVDYAVPPDRKSWPPRAILSISGTAVALILGCIVALFTRRFTDPIEAEKLCRLKTSLYWSRSRK